MAQQYRCSFLTCNKWRMLRQWCKVSVLFIFVLHHSDWRHLWLPSLVWEDCSSPLHFRPGRNVHHLCLNLQREFWMLATGSGGREMQVAFGGHIAKSLSYRIFPLCKFSDICWGLISEKHFYFQKTPPCEWSDTCWGVTSNQRFSHTFTLIGLCPSVNHFMHSEVWLLCKDFTTLTTLLGLLPSVNVLMLGEVWLQAKCFSTLTTLIGLTPVWILSGMVRYDFQPKVFPHWLHW
jgi:hypothetical protein